MTKQRQKNKKEKSNETTTKSYKIMVIKKKQKIFLHFNNHQFIEYEFGDLAKQEGQHKITWVVGMVVSHMHMFN